MKNSIPNVSSVEHNGSTLPGGLILILFLATFFGGIAAVISGAIHHQSWPSWIIWAGIVAVTFPWLLVSGFFILQPNEARVLVLFGNYRGTVRAAGFHWVNPFTDKLRISLRARNQEGASLKVNDKQGNPIEIAAVVVWQVRDTAKALFDVEDYEDYVRIQSETALRHVASMYAYDHGEEHEITLRAGGDEVAKTLCTELRDRLAPTGVEVLEARLMHLAYAQEIASAMLRRQQAEAVIAARRKIVHGAVSMVEMALHELSEKGVVSLDDERKAGMVSNLMVVLCGDTNVHPVINTGTLHN